MQHVGGETNSSVYRVLKEDIFIFGSLCFISSFFIELGNIQYLLATE